MALKIALEIMTPLPLTSKDDGREIFNLWQKYLPTLLPDKFGNWEPIDRSFDIRNIDHILDAWKWPFLSTRKKPFLNATIFMRKDPSQTLHATWNFDADATIIGEAELMAFLEAASVALKADFSCLHLLTEAELERGRARKTTHALNKQATKLFFSIYSKDLQRRIPDLFWATVLGRPYVEMFGREKLLSAAAHDVRLLSDQTVILQVTNKLSDVARCPGTFSDARSRIIQSLGEDAFFQATREIGDNYRAPHFRFPQTEPLPTPA